jgi:hypothetical protein
LRGKSKYHSVHGRWLVPSVTGEFNNDSYSSLWVGLDGWGHDDLVQAGTEQQCYGLKVPFLGIFINFSFSNYYAWTEFLPQEQDEQLIKNLPVNPGDEILVWVWLGDKSSFSPDLKGAFGRFRILNVTTGKELFPVTARGSTVVSCTEAVWIMESPYKYGFTTDLANFGKVTMFNDIDKLSTVEPLGIGAMRFTWHAFY